jgi:signal transduction histidine kinase
MNRIGEKNLDVRVFFENGIKNIFQITTYLIIFANILDVINYVTNSRFLFFSNIIIAFIAVLVLVLFYLRVLHYRIGFTVLIYAVLINVFSGKFVDSYVFDVPVQVGFFLRDSLFVIFLLNLASFALHRIHAIIIGIMYMILGALVALRLNDPFLNSSLVLLAVVIGAYCGLTWYLVGIFERAILDQRRKGILIMEQAEELSRRNDQLAELSRSKDILLSVIGHDLKNSFNIILLSTQILHSRFNGLTEEKKKNLIEIIENTSSKTYLLLENLLNWARMQTDSIKFLPERFNLKQIIRDCLELYSESIDLKQIAVEFEFDTSYEVYADKDMINTVVRNLLSNAIKFTNSKGRISLRCSRGNNIVNCSVEDTGIGLNQQELESLFNLDTIIVNTGTDGESGTGLGLILCRDFLQMNNGNLEVKSEAGKGSNFSFSLPAPASHPQAPSPGGEGNKLQ